MRIRERMYVYFPNQGGWHVWLKGQRWGEDPWIEIVWDIP